MAIPLAFASHFVLDVIPHSDFSAFTKADPELRKITRVEVIGAVVDILIGVFLILKVLDSTGPMVAGSIAAVFPDAVDNVPPWHLWLRRQSWSAWFHRLHHSFDRSIHYERSTPTQRVGGAIAQLVVAVGAIWFLLLTR